MALGQIGFLTNAAETLATAIGAGMLLGSFGAGALGLLTQPRQIPQTRVLVCGYYGGFFGAAFFVFDLVARYGQ